MKKSKNLLYEQGQYGYHCNTTTGVCSQGTQGNPGPFPNLPACQANCGQGTPACANVANGYECYYCPGPRKEQQANQDIRVHEKYQPTTSPVGCKMVANNTSLLTDGTNLYNTILECETAEEECGAQSTDMEECHCCTTGGSDAAYTQNMGFFAVGHCGYCNTSGCNPWNPGSGTLYSNFWNCAPISQGPLDCSIIDPPWAPKVKQKDMVKIKEETKIFKKLITEQGQYGYHCNTTTGVCSQGTQGNPGPFPNLPACQAACSPPTCENNPTLNCYFCLHHPGGQCISFQNYYTYGSGAPGMNPSQAFLNSQVVPDVSNPGVFLSHQGGAIYDNEADCIASGCDPADDFTNSNTPTSAVKPLDAKDTKFTKAHDREDIDIEIERAISEEVNRIKQLLK